MTTHKEERPGEVAGAQHGLSRANAEHQPTEVSPASASPTRRPEPNLDAAIHFLQRWSPSGPWLLTSIDAPQSESARRTGPRAQSFSADETDELRRWLAEEGAERNVYFSPNPLLRIPEKGKAKKTDVRAVVALHVDLDPRAGEDLASERQRMLSLLRSPPRGVPLPTLIVDSGGGFQAYWRLRAPAAVNGDEVLAAEVEQHTRALELALGGDRCHNVDRILRLPGTMNRPDWKKRAKGRAEATASVVEWHEERAYDLSQFTKTPPTAAAMAGKEPATAALPAPRRLASLDELPQGVSDYCKVVIAQGGDPDNPRKWPSRSEALHYTCCELVRAGVADEVILGIITDPGWGISASVLEKGRSAQRYAGRQVQRAREVAEELDCDKLGVPNRSLRNIRMAVAKLGVELEHDEFAGRSLISGLPGFGPHVDDKAVNRLWLLVEERFRLVVPKERFWAVVLDLALHHRRHPVREHLDKLQWDGTTRLDRWLVDYMGAEDSEYVRAVGAIVLVAAVRRVRLPGCKFDEMLVLEGPQGTKKSSALSALATRADWFSDDLPLNASPREFIEATIGKWIVEAGELKGMRKNDVESLKSCLSRGTDRARLAYGRLPEEHPRQFVIVGTTNSDRYLRDNTGNRRFWPVMTGEVNLSALMHDRDQIWAEAAEREASGASIRLDQSLWAAAGEQQESRRVEDPFLHELMAKLGAWEGRIASADVWRILGVHGAQRTQEQNARMGDAMRELGWQRRRMRFGGELEWGYVRGDCKTWIIVDLDRYGLQVRTVPSEGGANAANDDGRF